MENIKNILQTIKLKHWLIMKSWEVETDPFGDLYLPIKAAGFLKEIYYCYADYRITAKSAQAKSSSGSFFLLLFLIVIFSIGGICRSVSLHCIVLYLKSRFQKISAKELALIIYREITLCNDIILMLMLITNDITIMSPYIMSPLHASWWQAEQDGFNANRLLTLLLIVKHTLP